MNARISFILNTACLDPRAANRSNPHRAASYSERAQTLRSETLPMVGEMGFDEIFVVGVYEPSEDGEYEYVEMKPKFRDRRDALWQRDLGFRHSTGDILIFCHDDHRPQEGFVEQLKEALDGDWDILVPKRVHAATGEELNNGHPKFSALDSRPEEFRKEGYMGGHCLVMRRWVPARVPWTLYDTEFWDTAMTKAWRAAGAEIAFSDDLIHLDLEARENEQ